MAALVLLDGCLFPAAPGDARRALEWAGDLACVAGHDSVPVAAAAAHARGAALAAQGSYAALGPLGNPVQRWEALGRPYEAARAQAALRAGSLATSPRDQARRAEAGATLPAAQAIPRLQHVG